MRVAARSRVVPRFAHPGIGRALVESLAGRLRRGEGQILLVPIGVGIAAGYDAVTISISGFAVGVFLTSIYAFNDLCDCERDARDPGRHRAHAEFLMQNRSAFLVATLAGSLLAISLTAAFVNSLAWLAMVLVLAVNTAYSIWLKGTPGLDLLCAPVWGGGFAAMSGPVDVEVIALVGAMTTVCHVFQVRRDVSVDSRNGVRTALVVAPRIGAVVVAVCCAAMAFLVGSLASPVVGATAVLPLALFLSALSNAAAWVLSKVWFASVFLVILTAALP